MAAPRGLGFWQWFAAAAVVPTMAVWTKRNWSGTEHIPRTGGVILASNHASEFDPLVLARFVFHAGRWPQFLAKSSLFKVTALGPFLRAVKQIPVHRGSTDAARALEAAVAAVKAGEAIIVYPEGTTPKSGELWPQRGKTGIARLYLQTHAPVVPVVTWGAQQIYDPRVRKLRVRPRVPVTAVAGPPLDLSKWDGVPPTPANLYALTDEIMVTLRDMLAEVRGEVAPEQPSAARNGGAG